MASNRNSKKEKNTKRNEMIEIGGLQRSTLIDYPGHIACTVFLIGCNFRCPWCHSPEIVVPDLITKHPRISKEEFMDFLDIRKGLLDGVVVCGGEPTINSDLSEFVSAIKSKGFKVKLDTNGSNPTVLEGLLANRLLDYVAMDIKTSLKDLNYQKATGVCPDLEKVKKSIELIKASGVDYEFRTTVVPGLHKIEDIKAIAESISPAKKYFLQTFRSGKNIDSSLIGVPSYSTEFMEELNREIEEMFEVCKTR